MQPTEHESGFEIPVHRSLTTRLLAAGVPREFALINATFTAAFVFGLQFWYALPIGIVIHLVATRLTRRDEQFFDVIRRAVRLRVFYRA